MDALRVVESVFGFVEANELDKAVLACLRLARMTSDTHNVIMFVRELYPDPRQLQSAFLQETEHLGEDARHRLWKSTQEQWIVERTTSFTFGDEDDGRNVLAMGVGNLCREIEQMERSIDDLRLPEGMAEFDIAAFTDRDAPLKGQMRMKIRACHEVLERIRMRCAYYATRLEAQLAAEAATTDVVGRVQQDVHNFYAERCEPVFHSLRKAASLIGSNDTEDHALLLTSIRRAVKAAADFHYPAHAAPVVCSDGEIRILGDEQYLNRWQEFCARDFQPSASAGLLRAEADYMIAIVRRLNEVASKGVHSQVSSLEARQGLLGVYMFLSNVVTKLNTSG